MTEHSPELVSLAEIAAQIGKPLSELMERLPPPSLVSVENDVVCAWPILEVRGRLHEAAKQGLFPLVKADQKQYLWTTQSALSQEWKKLRGELGDLRNDIERQRETLRTLRTQVSAAEDYLRTHDLARENLDASLQTGTEALWSWEPPMTPPERLQGVYRLMREGRTIYIGQSVDIIARVTTHAAEKDFDQFSYALVDGDGKTLNEIESALIIIERPLENHGADGKLRHPTGHGWSRDEALAIIDKYRPGIAA